MPTPDPQALAAELHLADPDPTLERVAALAEHSQLVTPAHPSEAPFAWQAYLDAGGRELTPWRAFQAGLRAAAAWGGRRA
jgi:hypothetical protein